MLKSNKVARLQSSTLLKMNYFTSSFKLSEWLHSYHRILNPIITAFNTHVFHGFDFVAPQSIYNLSIVLHLRHLFHSVTLWYFIDFSCVLWILIPHQNRLHLQLNSEVYPEHSWTSKIEHFVKKKVNRFQPLTVFTKSSILDIRLGSEFTPETHLLNLYI